MKRKGVRELLQVFAKLRAAIRSARDDTGRRLACRPAAPPGAARAYGPLFDHLEAEVAAVESDLAAAEDAYGAATLRPTELRRRRDEAAAKLYELHAPLQRVLVTLPALRVSGIVVAGTPTSPPALAEQAARTVEVLRQLERDPPPLRWVSIEAGPLAADLEAGRRRLKALLEEVDGVGAAVAFAREEAARAVARADGVASPVAGMMEGLAGLAEDGRVGGQIGSW